MPSHSFRCYFFELAGLIFDPPCSLVVDTDCRILDIYVLFSRSSILILSREFRLFYHYLEMHAFSKKRHEFASVISTRIVKGHEFEVCLRIQDMEIGLFIVRRVFPSQIASIPRDY